MSQANQSSARRLHYLDNLRIFLTTLVILHHTVIPYGGEGNWAFKSKHHATKPYPPFVLFNAINQTFFMGLFFFISGYNTRIAAGKRSRGEFLVTKWKRLGLPCLVYAVVSPVLLQIVLRIGEGGRMTAAQLLDTLRSVRGVRGPPWYLATLLIFDVVYICLPRTWLNPSKEETQADSADRRSQAPMLTPLIVLMLDCSISFLVRLFFPTSYVFRPLGLRVGYLPQYVIAYWSGTKNETLALPSKRIISRQVGGLLLSLVVASSAAALSFIKIDSNPKAFFESATGGLNPLAALYAVWNEAAGYLIGGLLLDYFKLHMNSADKLGLGKLAKFAFATFLAHEVVSVAIEVACDGLFERPGLANVLLLGILNVSASWSVGWLMCQVPTLKNFL